MAVHTLGHVPCSCSFSCFRLFLSFGSSLLFALALPCSFLLLSSGVPL